MGEVRDLNEILSGVDALDRRLRAIEEYRKNAPDMSDEALREMRGELDLIRAALGVPETERRQAGAAARRENARETGWYHRTGPAVYRGGTPQDKPAHPRIAGSGKLGPKGYSNVRTAPPAPKMQRTNLSERNLGKYLLGVLAAVLVLLAAGVLIAAVWPVIPDILKLLALLACGVGMQLIGMRFVLQSENRRNGFWLSVTGLGAGVSLMAAAAGCLAWGLYPLAVAGLLAAVWFGCNLLCAKSLDSPVFYVIAYIGAALAVMLSVNLATAGSRPDFTPFRLADQIPVAVMPVLILILGDFAASRHPRRCLRVLNYLAALFFIGILGVFAEELTYYVDVHVDLGELYLFFLRSAPGVVIAPAILLIFAHLIHISPDALERRREKPGLDWLRVLTVVIAGFAGMFAVYRGVNSVAVYASQYVGGDPAAAVTGAAVTLVVIGVILIRRDQIDYLLLGLTVPMTLLFASVSDSLFDLPCLFPVLLCILLFTWNRMRRRDSFQLALWLALSLSGLMVVSQSEWYHGADREAMGHVLPFIAACFAYLAVLYLTYAGELKRADRSEWQPVTSLGCAVLIGLTAAKGAYTAMICFRPDVGSETVYPGLVALALLFHRWYVQARTRSESGTAGLARLLWSVCAGIFTIYLHMCIAFTSGAERGVCIMVLMIMAGSTVAWASASGSKVYAVLSVLFANEALAFAGGVNDVYGLALSVVGVCLCAGFIWLGFFRERRTMRRLGLAGMILYVIKIALLDIQSASGGVVSTALGLLFAGLVCFGVSFVYNRLDKKYGGGGT